MSRRPFLTVFTSTYNRAHTLSRTYESLLRQTDKDFEWIVVDDGSTDDTEQLVKPWIDADNGFLIQYIKKENEGFHTGYNVAIAHANGVLATCVDSDDYMPDDAVELIHSCWSERGGKAIGGIVGLDYSIEGDLVGSKLPDLDIINLIDLSLGKYQTGKGDKKVVVRTDLYKSVAPMKVFPGEKFFNPHYMALEISRTYDFLVLNKCLCIVEYLPGGMGSNMFRQYKNSPNSFLEIRKQRFSFDDPSFASKVRNGIHFISSAIISKRLIAEFWQSSHKGILLICMVPGALLAIVTEIKGS